MPDLSRLLEWFLDKARGDYNYWINETREHSVLVVAVTSIPIYINESK